MFGLGRFFRREIRKAVREVVQSPQSTRSRVLVSKQIVTSKNNVQSIETQTVEQEVINGKCHVIDADTIVIGKQDIHFAGIDAPELHNPYGKQAKWALVELCKGQTVTAYLTGETSYNRVVAKCFLDHRRDLAAEMVKLELALDIPHFPNADYKHLETPKARRKPLWRPKKKK